MSDISEEEMAFARPIPEFSPAESWTAWKEGFECFLSAMRILDEEQKLVNLKFIGGSMVRDLLKTLPDEVDETVGSEYYRAMSKLDKYHEEGISIVAERHEFKAMTQLENELVKQFYVRLRKKAVTCQFENAEERIQEQLLDGLTDEKLKRRAGMNNYTVQQILKDGAVSESYTKSTSASTSSTVNYVDSKNKTIKCFYCKKIGHTTRHCKKLLEYVCKKCNKKGHTEKRCRDGRRDDKPQPRAKKQRKEEVKYLSSSSDSDEGGEPAIETEYLCYLGGEKMYPVKIGTAPIEVVVDTGTRSNIVPKKHWEILKLKKIKVFNQTKQINKQFYSFGSDQPLKCLMSFESKIEANGESKNVKFYVLEKGAKCLLGHETAEDLKIISFKAPVSV